MYTAEDDYIEIEGTISQVLSHGNYKVKLPNETNHELKARVSGKMRKFNIRITNGDKVTIKISKYDLTNGLITYRHKFK